MQERSAAIASDRDAKAQEQGLVEAQANRDNARDKLKVASESMAEANRKLENLAKRRRDVNPGQRRREEAELKLAQTRAREEMARQQSEIERLESDIARLTKSSAESRASADKQLKAAKDAENAYRSCLNNCYDAASKSGSPRDKDEAPAEIV